MKQKKRTAWLMVLGVILMLGGLTGLYTGPAVSQYVFLPGEMDGVALLTTADTRFSGAFTATSLHGVTENVSLKSGETSQGEITLYQALGDYFHVYPRAFAAGRPLAWDEQGARTIVLDEKLAFSLFGDRDPLDQTVELNGKNYQVVGVASHLRRTGETGTCAAWIPLGAAEAPECSVLVLSAAGAAGSGLRTVFETTARETFGEGQAIFLEKERIRGTVLPRTVLLILGFWLLKKWIRWMNGRFSLWINGLREELKTKYPRQMPGRILGRSTAILLLTAGTITFGAGMVIWGANLMQVFPEWVPENLMSASAIAARFWDLTSSAAAPIRFTTPELAEIRLWSGLLRWGTLLTLTGWVVRAGTRPDGQKNDTGIANPEAL